VCPNRASVKCFQLFALNESTAKAMPVIGFMVASSLGSLRQQVAAFREGLKESAYVEGRNVAIEYRYAEGQPDRFPALAADLVRRQVAVFAVGGTGGARVAKQATTTIPIVFSRTVVGRGGHSCQRCGTRPDLDPNRNLRKSVLRVPSLRPYISLIAST
jgi:ABC-type uncharacterized transport system substrate-binding protein